MILIFRVNNLRHSWCERNGFHLLRMNGTDDFVFIHFITPVEIVLNSEMIKAPAHSCIIYPPHSHHEFLVEEGSLKHDWIHFMPTSPDAQQIFNLPLNSLFFPGNTGFISSLVTTIELEFINQSLFWERHVEGLMTCLFSLLGREINGKDASHKSIGKNRSEFDHLRLEMYNDPSFGWNIENMAARLQLSRSRFSVLYKQFYDTTPIEDLIAARIDRAKYLLSTSAMPVNLVSDEAGYNNVEHFIRQFIARTGSSPTVFRNLE